MNDGDLMRLVREQYDAAIDAGEIVTVPWLAQRILSKYALPEDFEEADFYACCALLAVKDQISRVVRREKQRSDYAEQMPLPGFKFLQPRYQITREEVSTIVPVELMNVAELRGKASELRAMSHGLLEHADEIDRYADAKEDAA